MLSNLPVEIILLICEYPEFKDLGQLAWTNNRMMRIIKRYLPIALERKILFYLPYENDDIWGGKICLFDSHNVSVEQIAKFTNYLLAHGVATTKDKIFALNSSEEWFEVYDLDTRQVSRGPDPPEWRGHASVTYFKDKLYYLGGYIPRSRRTTDRVDVLMDGQWQPGPAFPFPIYLVQKITCDGILYVIDGLESRKIYRLSDNEQEWIEIGEIPERRDFFGVATLNGKIYITGGENDNDFDGTFKSCLCFDPSAPIESRISQIADMNYGRYDHSLIVANGKLYAVGGYQERLDKNFCDSIEEYDPQTNEWREVGNIDIK